MVRACHLAISGCASSRRNELNICSRSVNPLQGIWLHEAFDCTPYEDRLGDGGNNEGSAYDTRCQFHSRNIKVSDELQFVRVQGEVPKFFGLA